MVLLLLGSWVWTVFPQARRTPEEEKASRNPFARDASAVAAGREWFQSRCAACHGADARGGPGAKNLQESRLVASAEESRLFQTIREGIRGTMMPPSDLPDEAVWQVVSYLHAAIRPGLQPEVPGDVEKGEQVFREMSCGGCHKVDGRGGILGPDLSAVALRRTSAEIRQSVLDPDALREDGYRTVVLTTQSGERMAGLLKNESNFSIQVLREDGEYGLFQRDELHSVDYRDQSLMPSDYGRRLNEDQLQNLLAYLDRRRSLIVESGPGRLIR